MQNGTPSNFNPSEAATPILDGAFEVPNEEKISNIAEHFKAILEELGLDVEDESLRDTPERVARMYVNEIFSGLDPHNKPEVTLFENKYGYDRMLLQKNISLFSFCEHHFLPIVGKAHVAYFSEGKIAGLSKLNRIVNYYARRPQVQERLTRQIALDLRQTLQTNHVAVIVEARHMCVSARGIQDVESQTFSSQYLGKFNEEAVRNEFLQYLSLSSTQEPPEPGQKP